MNKREKYMALGIISGILSTVNNVDDIGGKINPFLEWVSEKIEEEENEKAVDVKKIVMKEGK